MQVFQVHPQGFGFAVAGERPHVTRERFDFSNGDSSPRVVAKTITHCVWPGMKGSRRLYLLNDRRRDVIFHVCGRPVWVKAGAVQSMEAEVRAWEEIRVSEGEVFAVKEEVALEAPAWVAGEKRVERRLLSGREEAVVEASVEETVAARRHLGYMTLLFGV